MVMETVEPRPDGAVDADSGIIGRVVVEAGAEISGSAIIGAGSKISGSYVGPFTAIATNCAVDDSEIEYSIVLRGASIRGVRRIETSLIGHDVEVTLALRVHRLILGDHSKVQISS